MKIGQDLAKLRVGSTVTPSVANGPVSPSVNDMTVSVLLFNEITKIWMYLINRRSDMINNIQNIFWIYTERSDVNNISTVKARRVQGQGYSSKAEANN